MRGVAVRLNRELVGNRLAARRTSVRRADGAFPSVINPVAIWEIKEYYYTTPFGSRVADGVYETFLAGLELEELHTSTNRKLQHLPVVDDYFTWWECAHSYRCRMVDILHVGVVDEVLFGREVLTRMLNLRGDGYLRTIRLVDSAKTEISVCHVSKR